MEKILLISNNNTPYTFNEQDIPFTITVAEFSTTQTITFLSIVLPINIFILISNTFVIHSILTYPPLKTSSNILLISLAVSDLVMGSLVIPVAWYYTINGKWIFGVLGCKIWTFISFSCCCNSVLHFLVITTDRYLAIAYPVKYPRKRSNKNSLIVVTMVWLISSLSISPPFFLGWGITWPKDFDELTPCTIPQDPVFAIYMTCLIFYIPLLITLALNAKLYFMVKKRFRKKRKKASSSINTTISKTSTSGVDQQVVVKKPKKSYFPRLIICNAEGKPNRCHRCGAKFSSTAHFVTLNDGEVLCQICASPHDLVLAAKRSRLTILIQKERTFAYLMVIIVMTFIIFWFPAWTVYVITAVTHLNIPPWLMMFVWWMVYINSACNPIIYAVFNEDFKQALKKYFQRK